ncbi:MAG: type II toxin-antitoxin system HicA family toxin [Dehalococcoidia bacterium]|nr:type II toxin-antitoxin system HicA family toxin [Dehalococcoidia bacterium]
MRYREVVRKLRRLGCLEVTRKRQSGSHRRWSNPAAGQRASIPDHGRHDLKIGTLRSAIRDLGIDWQEFNDA